MKVELTTEEILEIGLTDNKVIFIGDLYEEAFYKKDVQETVQELKRRFKEKAKSLSVCDLNSPIVDEVFGKAFSQKDLEAKP